MPTKKMVNNYEFLKSIDLISFVKRGIISIHIMDYVLIYETYLDQLQKNKKSVAITYCSDRFNKHENSIRNIIIFLQNSL